MPGLNLPLNVSRASASASNIIEPWVMMSSFRREIRSAMIPAYNENNHTGMPLAKPTTPSMIGEAVNSYTRYPWAVDCIQVPISDTICPPNQGESSDA
jgi:hypothetical protein